MARRKYKLYRTIPSDAVQGEGSWVKTKSLSLDELVELSQNGENQLPAIEVGYKALAHIIVDWNWVDDEDKSLPKPPEDPEVIRRLPFQEVNFLLQETGIQDMFDTKN